MELAGGKSPEFSRVFPRDAIKVTLKEIPSKSMQKNRNGSYFSPIQDK